jgi:hypothetical protein
MLRLTIQLAPALFKYRLFPESAAPDRRQATRGETRLGSAQSPRASQAADSCDLTLLTRASKWTAPSQAIGGAALPAIGRIGRRKRRCP